MILTAALYEKNFRHVLKSDNWFFNFKSDIITKKLFIVNNISSQIEFNLLKEELQLNRDAGLESLPESSDNNKMPV